MKNKCYDCPYSWPAPHSSHHLECHFDWIFQPEKIPTFNIHGIQNGWATFPINFDPVWMIDECPVNEQEPNPNKQRPPIETLLLAGIFLKISEIAKRQAENARPKKSCDKSCGPGDHRPGGKCDQNGCYE